LHIFEPRYVAMTRDAIAGQPFIGMVQPIAAAAIDKPPVFGTGCAGRIVEWREAGDGRLLIALSGISRFQIVAELGVATPYRVVDASYAAFAGDLADDGQGEVDRAALLRTLKSFLGRRKFKADLETISRAPAAEMVNWLTMVLPFSPSEKQALLEAADFGQRAILMTRLMQLALLESPGGAAGTAH
jgi:Lon protease-like protein